MKHALAALLLLAAAPAAAEVVAASPGGFHLKATATVAATPEAVWAVLVQPARWWNGSHSYSGDAANITLDARAGGCWCEALPGGGSVEHGVAMFVRPGRALRLRAAFGPLQSEGVAGAVTWALKPVAGGTEITQSYVVGGYVRGGAETLAAPVDAVMSEALGRLAAAVGG